MSEEKEDNLIKQVCKELNLTYKELGEKIGFTEGSIRSSVFLNKISKQMEQAIKLLIENEALKSELDKTKQLKNILKEFLK